MNTNLDSVLDEQEVYKGMFHSREELIERTIREFELLEELVAGLSDEDWERPLLRPEGKDPWTVKDALVHIAYWKADVARMARGQRRSVETRGLRTNDHNHLVYERWRDRSPHEILAWHRQVQEDVLSALREAPEAWFSGRERGSPWPFDLDGHSAYHRVHDIERALAAA
jgi:Mycothiol maleylpyruvate isomerase N-terminal domain